MPDFSTVIYEVTIGYQRGMNQSLVPALIGTSANIF